MRCDRCYKEDKELYRYSPGLAFFFCRECIEKMKKVKEKAQRENKKGKHHEMQVV